MNFSGPRPPGQSGRGGALLRLRQDVQDRPRRRRQRRVQRPRQMPLHVVNIDYRNRIDWNRRHELQGVTSARAPGLG